MRMLQLQDVNVPPSPPHQKQKGWTVGITGAGDAREHVYVPTYRTGALTRSQRHCTPSSLEPTRESPLAGSCETRQLSLAQLNASVLYAEIPALHTRGPAGALPHTPSSSVVSRGRRVGDGQWINSDDGHSTATPRSTERRLYKRSREDGGPAEEESRCGF